MSAFSGLHFKDTFDGEVNGLRGAGSKNNFSGISIDKGSKLLAGNFYRFGCLPAKYMSLAGCISKLLTEIRHHRLHHPRIAGRSGVIVHVYRKLEHGQI